MLGRHRKVWDWSYIIYILKAIFWLVEEGIGQNQETEALLRVGKMQVSVNQLREKNYGQGPKCPAPPPWSQ